MRIKILKHSKGILDGVSLSHLLPGLVYEVPISLGTWLMSQGTAEEEVSPTVGLVVPLDKTSIFSGGVRVSSTKDHEDDRPPGRNRVHKKR